MRLRRLLRTAAAITLLPLGLSACTSATTDVVYTPAQGVTERDAEVDVLNALIVSDEEGEGRFIAGLANDNREAGDALVEVSGAGEDASVEVEMKGGAIELEPGGFVQIADIGSQADGVQVIVSGDAVKPGYFVRLSLQFANAETVEMHVPVVTPGEDFGPFISESPSGEASTDSEPRPEEPSETISE